MIIVILVSLIALIMIAILIDQYPAQLQVIMIIVEMLVGLVIAGILVVYVLLKVRTLKTSLLSWILVSIFTLIIGFGMGLQNNTILNPYSLSAHLIGFILIIDVLFPITFIKFLYYVVIHLAKFFTNNRN